MKRSADEPNSYSHIVKYTGLFGGVQGLNILIGIVRNKLVATILGPSGMGLISLFNSTINLVSNSTNLGIQMSAVRNISEIYDSGDKAEIGHVVKLIRSWSLLTALAGMLLCIVLSPLLSYWTFGWGNHTLHFIFLSPVIGLMAIAGGEMAILKGTRHLKRLAVISIYNMLAALFTSIPIYYFFGESGIVPSLIVMALFQMIFAISYSYRLFPLKISFNKGLLGEGFSIVRLGIAFVAAGILGSGAEYVIRSYLSFSSSLETVGLFTAGYMMTMTYSGLVFSAMETDYFPRLSAIHNNIKEANLLVNRQMEVSLLLIAPILVFFTISLPILIPLLYTGKFVPVMGMMQVMVLAMYMRAIKLPLAYMPLSKGDSATYLILESIYDVIIVLFVIFAFNKWGLTGCGIAITAAGLVDFFLVLFYVRFKYHYRCSQGIKRYMAIQLPIGILAYLFTFIENGFVYWFAGGLLTMASAGISYELLRKKSSLLPSALKKFRRKKDDNIQSIDIDDV